MYNCPPSQPRDDEGYVNTRTGLNKEKNTSRSG